MGLIKKVTIALMTALLLMALPECIHAAPQKEIATESELIEYLQGKKEKGRVTVEFTCSPKLYSELSEDDFRELYRLLYKAGINGAGVTIYYDDKAHSVRTTIRYEDKKSYDCESMTALRDILGTIKKEKVDSAVLICSPEFYKMVADDKQLLDYSAAKHGISGIGVTRYDEIQVIEIDDFDYVDGAYACVNDYAQFAAAIDEFKKKNLKEFYIAFSPQMYKEITKSASDRTVMIAGSKLDQYGYISRGDGGILKFYSVTYTDAAREVCTKVGDLAGIISRMGAAGVADFEIYFTDKNVFEEIYKDDFTGLHKIESEAGMISSDLSYSMDHDRISYKNASIKSEAVPLKSISEAVSYTEKKVGEGSDEINLFCKKELYDKLMGNLDSLINVTPNSIARIYDLISHAGIYDYELSGFPATNVITIRVKQLYPGTAIILAEKSGDLSKLTEKEKKTREAALKVAKAAENKSPIQTAKYIHDWICEKTEYLTTEDKSECDTSIGAILNGKADCDGYSDAFYLIGSLAGLDVRYQHGDSLEKGLNAGLSSVFHVWNLVNINGTWRMIDVTWDDQGDYPFYVWFNVGQDVASLTHTWNDDMTVALAPETKREVSAENDFYVKDTSEIKECMNKVNERKPEGFFIIAPGLKEDEVLKAVNDNTRSSGFVYSWNEKMSMLSVTKLEW